MSLQKVIKLAQVFEKKLAQNQQLSNSIKLINAVGYEVKDSKQIQNVQTALKNSGSDPGTVDGIWGTKSDAALRDYQTKNNFPVDGKLNPQTVQGLDLF